MSLNSKNLIQILHAEWIGSKADVLIDNISIDSRSLQNGANTLFFALSGVNNDAHLYILDLIEKGVQNFVVRHIPEDCAGKANFLVVNDTVTALQQFAGYYRNLFHFPIIGLTGSNGKTIVKEWLNFLLSPDYNIIRSPKSYNSQVGVPLSVVAINEKHNLGIFEAGISTVDEMIKLENMIKPNIGVLTNIGSAHDEGFLNLVQKIDEKLLLFKESEVIIYQKNEVVDSCLSQFSAEYMVNSRVLFSWSFTDKNADVFILKKENKSDSTAIQYQYKGEKFDLEIPFLDSASVENSITCLLVLLYLKYDFGTIQGRMQLLYPVEMRLAVKNGVHNCSVIDDSYSSDFQSLKIALDFLESQKKNSKKTVILSDILQSGFSNEELYTKVAQLIAANKVSRIIGIGETISSFKEKFSNITTFQNTADFITHFESLAFANETILIKGARAFQFEEIVALLEEKTHETILEINLDSISHNLNFFKSKLGQKIKIMVMVKAFGYGNGGLEIAKLLEHHKVDYLGVAFADEGISLKNGGIKLPIMVLNPESTSFPSIIQYHLEPEIYSVKGLNSFLKIAQEKKLKEYPIHIKLDTGMHRLGFEENNLDELVATLKGNTTVRIQSILSHMATSDEVKHYEFANSQIQLFEKLSSKLMNELNVKPIRHILNTSGISNFPDAQYDMVRLGIGLYGVSNDAVEQKYLENVGTLKSVISQVRSIPAGDSVGYGRRFMAQKITKIATIPIGYADGISRLWGNEVGYVMIKNQKAPIVGSICMDMLMVNVTEIDCKEGDAVVIFGENPTVIEIAKALKTIPYEILTSISQRVKRVFFR
ncbi:bifunctional UDP-N-acetylmuramoyl-tripeptide:D-alanyl-D-alanine ligase/alanine racemase [Flavobacterium sp. Fl-77]|uniref:Alanine racemase n=1 Tax=Flavobacterium flavipigmentatum TaxID=2893884 RepID=A0AAJ2VW55_9FLAO|nr:MULTISPECIES: bifunctional UDP-N-acetylmuramoyl-tripeptide:D-alanyl-D-alanine ligase/alanine racemase [unclassified Flavobacterium]MDX6181227.1 bifunctional UDP-N-acetylmuramoyl-tripeptide:D-alanyl-D-alanine ligase/alanine racemase [Flavobacterium sp. Fl-33]MDX6184828.1 bifunctional UDP-N-acetylmuramoyl-tripeptide:D-alanyl-D-alanine ligase/alanine racemase [Flavobacterium sp. Fl-77]UFH39924.1 bifunctional UDP-N-acetylmuramoyl-tripeptide:D-alanyl-D-alanine ligase/alanine racemase [Flavobacteri